MLIKIKNKPRNIILRDFNNGTCALQRLNGSLITVLSYRNDLKGATREIERIDRIEGQRLRQLVRSGELVIK